MERQEQKRSWLSNLKAPMAGAFSGCVTRAITQPLDCSKVRLQLQIEPVANVAGARYTGTIQTLIAIFRDEGVCGLWKGHIPAQLLSVFYGLGQFAAYDQLNSAGRHVKLLNEHSDTRHFICGGIAGAVGNTVSTPFDVIRTRIIAQDHGRGYSSMRDGLRLIFVNEGVRGLFRGLGPSVLQVAPLTAIQFWAYNVVIETVLDYTKTERATPHLILFAGAIGGIVSKTAVYPLDLCKKRLQIQKFQNSRLTYGEHFICKGLCDCLARTISREGYRGLFKGLLPSVIKSGIATALHFFMYEELLSILVRVQI
jgi:solute carrier family 25 thiamine pyrophosphate transporter 19